MHITLPEPKPTRFLLVRDTLEALRAILPLGLVCLSRSPDDPDEIEETWF